MPWEITSIDNNSTKNSLSLIAAKDQELMAKYGEAILWINQTEFLLKQIVLHVFKPTTKKILEKINSPNFGPKIEALEKILSSKNPQERQIVGDLKKLNEEKRRLMAHGIIVESQEGSLVLRKEEQRIYINYQFLDEVKALAIKISEYLTNLLKKTFEQQMKP